MIDHVDARNKCGHDGLIYRIRFTVVFRYPHAGRHPRKLRQDDFREDHTGSEESDQREEGDRAS